jgi:hypothetical protein
MNLKMIGLILIITLITTMPLVQGFEFKVFERQQSELTSGKTYIRGIILLPRITNKGKINFYAIRLAYKTFNIEGLTYGAIKFQNVEIPKNFNGFYGRFFIYGTFFGKLII